MTLRKSFLMARRDYLATVLTKGFIFGLLVPAFVGLLIGGVSKVLQSSQVKRIAIVDHTGLGVGADILQVAQLIEEARKANPGLPSSGIRFEAGADARDVLVENVKNGKLFGILDIVSTQKAVLNTASGTGGVSYLELSEAVNDGMRRARLVQSGIDPVRFTQVLVPVPLEMKSVNAKDTSGKSNLKQNVIQSVAIPVVLMVMMSLIVLGGATNMLAGVAEDKKERVFEMLLASATPLEIVAGKVIASVAISLTSAVVWIGGATAALYAMGFISLAPLHMLPWFFVYLICQITMLSATGAALGSATNSPREAQHFGLLLVGPSMLPLLFLVGLIDQPNGPLAAAMSFTPPFTPLVMMFRQAMPGGVPMWQPWVALVGVLLWTALATWAASRIFRVGLLMQGKQPSLVELVRWAIRG